MKTCVSSYSFSQYLNRGDMTLFDCIKKASEIGFDAIEFIGFDEELSLAERISLAKELKSTANDCGIQIPAYLIGSNLFKSNFDKEFDRIKGEIEIADALGVSLFRHDETFEKPGINKKGKSFGLMLPTLVENTLKVTEYACGCGIKTCTENHGFTCQDSYRMEQLYNSVNNRNFGLLIDIGNFICVDEDSATAVSRLAPYALHAHAKDFLVYPYNSGKDGLLTTRGGNIIEGTAVGNGDIPVERCIKILSLAEYDGFVSIEYEGKGDCIEGITTGYKNLKGYIENV